jgi:hypothetical protein
MKVLSLLVFLLSSGFIALAQAQMPPGFADEDFSRRYAPSWPPGTTIPLRLVACKAGNGYTIARARFYCAGAQVQLGRDAQTERLDTPLTVQFGKKTLTANLGKLSAFQPDGVPFLDSVHMADLNGDGEPDLVLEFSYHGNGLAAVRRTLGFLVSGATGYRLFAVENLLAPGRTQLVKDKASGTATMMLGRMSSDVSDKELQARDGKTHTFFVFDAIRFSAQPKADLLTHNEFLPIYVQFTYLGKANPASRASSLLDKKQLLAHWKTPLAGVQALEMTVLKE